MKIVSQDREKVFGFGDCHIEEWAIEWAVHVNSNYGDKAPMAGIYSDKSRAKGVLQEMILAFERGEGVFYMPSE